MIFPSLIWALCNKVELVITIVECSHFWSTCSSPICIVPLIKIGRCLEWISPKILSIECHVSTVCILDILGAPLNARLHNCTLFLIFHHLGLQSKVPTFVHPNGTSSSIFGILGSNLESRHLLHNLIGGHEMVVMPSLQALQISWLKRHERTNILSFDPSIIHMRGTMITKSIGNSFEPSDRKSTRLNSSHRSLSRMPSSA